MMAAFELLPWAITISTLYIAMALVFWYALAFSFRDICWGFIYVTALLEIWSVLPAPDPNVVPSR